MRGMFGTPPRILFHNPQEQLTGMVQGLKASDLEERAARSIAKLQDWQYTFRMRVNPVTHELSRKFTNLKGELELDYLVSRGSRKLALLVDGEISHYLAAWQKDVDDQKTAAINSALRKYGYPPAIRVPYWELADQDMSDNYFRNLLT